MTVINETNLRREIGLVGHDNHLYQKMDFAERTSSTLMNLAP